MGSEVDTAKAPHSAHSGITTEFVIRVAPAESDFRCWDLVMADGTLLLTKGPYPTHAATVEGARLAHTLYYSDAMFVVAEDVATRRQP